MNAKFSQLGVLLTREEAKKITGGGDNKPKGGNCLIHCYEDGLRPDWPPYPGTPVYYEGCYISGQDCSGFAVEKGFLCPQGYGLIGICS